MKTSPSSFFVILVLAIFVGGLGVAFISTTPPSERAADARLQAMTEAEIKDKAEWSKLGQGLGAIAGGVAIGMVIGLPIFGYLFIGRPIMAQRMSQVQPTATGQYPLLKQPDGAIFNPNLMVSHTWRADLPALPDATQVQVRAMLAAENIARAYATTGQFSIGRAGARVAEQKVETFLGEPMDVPWHLKPAQPGRVFTRQTNAGPVALTGAEQVQLTAARPASATGVREL
jgi:hypothetical protein